MSPLISPSQLNVLLAISALWLVVWTLDRLVSLMLAERANGELRLLCRRVFRRLEALARQEIVSRPGGGRMGSSSSLEWADYRCQHGRPGVFGSSRCQSEGEGQCQLCPLKPEVWLREVRERVKREAAQL